MTQEVDLWLDDDTIVALSTPPGIGGLAVVRISGSRAVGLARTCVPGLPRSPSARRADFVELKIRDELLDRGLVTVFPAPASYTGEEVVEISLHGSPVLVDRLIAALCSAGARRAQPGEFTLRAFRNGRIDLLQAEAVNELIHARTLDGARMAISSMEGALTGRLQRLRTHLVELGAALETEIEFGEDQHIGNVVDPGRITSALKEIRLILERARFNEVLSNGLKVVIAGRVNAGKSTLFNSLLGHDRALVSSRPGTTRDFLTETIYIDGFPVDLTDVAGWDAGSRDELESQGIRRGVERLNSGDAVLFLVDASRPLSEADHEMDKLSVSHCRLVVATKMDQADPEVLKQIRRRYAGNYYCEVCALNEPDLPAVKDFLRSRIQGLTRRKNDFVVSARQRELLRDLEERLSRLCTGLEKQSYEVELLAEELRGAMDCIGRLTGGITSAEVLDAVFSRFCIGK
ncbi:MAG: tRNA uridine-5-carboxymethylaminomethyl(34) synthesis GTPase MnmE [Candidatus Aminicenantes bacterium]|nr:tRNA uridine-5-carboxymethylaminomethyl(34) synthesis GTPase MnmE [Candidatus Aminicenantes bacterium]